MSCFTTVSAVTAAGDLDSTKHVNYTAGMILGVDDFTQEFAYLAGRDRWLARDALGFGTVSGLSVKIEKDGAKGYRVMISSGVAISRRGQLICVPAAQCAYLNQWLTANIENLPNNNTTSPPLSPPLTSPSAGNDLTLYVVLCYRDCLTDNVPIPGEPCRNEDELMSPSRVKDDFSLELRLKAPDQPEEQAVRDYVEWLKQIKITDAGASTSLEDFERAIRERWLSPASPPVSSPPSILQIHADDVCEYMRTAFRIWVTELRDFLSDRKTGCCSEMTGGATLDDCVLLAELHIPLTSVSPGWQVSETGEIEINQENRPFLLHLRMLQEWMLCGCHCAAETIPPITSPSIPVVSPPFPTAHSHNLDSLSDVAVQSPADGQILTFRNGEWIAESLPIETPTEHNHLLANLGDVEIGGTPSSGQVLIFRNGFWVPETPSITGEVIDHNTLNNLASDDHLQYLLTNGSRVLTGDLQGGGKRIVNLAAANANGQAVIFQQAIKQNDAAGGDLGGTYPNPTISKLQGKPISATPTEGQILIFKGGKWIAETPVTQTGGVTDHGLLTGLVDDDHKQYLLIDGSREMTKDLKLGGNRIVNLLAGNANGQAVIFEQAIKQNDNAGGDLGGKYPNPTINRLQGKPIDVTTPADGQSLIFKNGAWIPGNPQASGVITDHGNLTGLADDDHPQYLLINGTRALTGNLKGGNNRITNLAAGTANGDAVIFQQAIKQNDNAGGDLSGKYPNPTIDKLQGKPVKADAPNKGDALVWDGTIWVPQKQTPEPFIILPLATITRVGILSYQIWFNIDAPENLAEIKTELNKSNVNIFDETDTSPAGVPPPFLTPISAVIVRMIRNVYSVKLTLEQGQIEPDYMRFRFSLNAIAVSLNTGEISLSEYAKKNKIKFPGSLDGETATIFVRGTGIKAT